MPYLPFVDREGCHVDFTGIGELWDAQTVASVCWGLRDVASLEYDRVTLKDGTSATSRSADLMQGAVRPRHTPFGHSQIRRGAVLRITERRAFAETRYSRQRSRATGHRFMRSWPVELLFTVAGL